MYQKERAHRTRRDRNELFLYILKMIADSGEDGIGARKIVDKVSLNYKQFTKYIKHLKDAGLIEEEIKQKNIKRRILYRIRSGGRETIEAYNVLHSLMPFLFSEQNKEES